MQSLIIFILANLTNQVNTLKHESRTEKPLGNTAQFAPYGLSTICVAKMLDNVGLRYPHRASGTKAPRTLRPLPLLRFAVSATGGAHLCSIQYYLRFWLSSCRTSLAVSVLRIMRYCPKKTADARRGICRYCFPGKAARCRPGKNYLARGAHFAFSQTFSSSVRRGLSISYTWAW